MPIYFLLFMLLLCPLFAAQQSGTVRSGDLVIPGATITATQGDTKIVTTADESGQYVFKDLPAGAWTLQVDMFGFTPARREVTVDDKPTVLDWTLELKPRSQPAPVSTSKPPAAESPGKPSEPRQTRSGETASKETTRKEPSRSASSRGQNGGRQNQGGFRNLNLNDATDGQVSAIEEQRPDQQGMPEGVAGGTESFLVNGSLSTGLDAPGQQGAFDYYRHDDPNRPFGEGFGGGAPLKAGDPEKSARHDGGRFWLGTGFRNRYFHL